MLDYDSATGMFRWKAVKNRPDLVGKPAGGPNDEGYLNIRIDGEEHKAHRLAWLHVHGRWPEQHLDHENGNPSDNRIANLREASRSQNLANAKRRTDNRSGFKGVSFYVSTGKWGANINKDGRRHYLGQFETPGAAHEAYLRAARGLHGEFARGN